MASKVAKLPVRKAAAGASSSKSTGGSKSTTVSSKSTSGGYSGGVDYHKAASDAAARGDWSAVEKALTARQAKIDAQGGNDRGTTNAQILNQLRNQYGTSYSSLPSGVRDRVSLAAGEKLPFTNYQGTDGSIYKDKGWQDGVDYLSRAQQYAKNGDLDGAYEALMRRGFKMADTGSLGGGTSQDQAYALIHQMYNQSPGGQRSYQDKLAANQKALQEHQTQFGLEVRPELAYKQIKSTDGRYWIIYDGQGRPSAAKPVSARLGDGKPGYSQQEMELMSQYYGGTGDRAELERQLHNLAVVRTGNGRLIGQDGSWASGAEMPVGSARDWTGLPTERNTNQDRAALQEILDQINAGEFSGSPAVVPTLTTRGSGTGRLTGGGSSGIPAGNGGNYGDSGYGGDDLSAYLRQMYQENLTAQLAALQAAYQQNVAQYQAHDDLLSRSYRDQRNQAAAHNDLQRMYMAEMGAMQGLNTGATGQLALAQSMAYQGGLAELLAAENQDRAENDLAKRNLAVGYQGDVAAAEAQSNSQLAGALYNEYVRQIQAAEAAQQAQLEQERWQMQWDYQKQQDALDRQQWQTQWDYSQQADRQGTAYKLASTMLSNGVMPDSATLAAAGISRDSAAALLRAYQGFDTGSAGGRRSGTGGGKESESRSQDGDSDGQTGQGFGVGAQKLNSIISGLNGQLTRGNTEAADGYVRSVWNTLSAQEQSEIQRIMAAYGLQYTP